MGGRDDQVAAADQIVIAHDVCFKTRLASYGGPGYAHISTNVTRWMAALGMPAEAIKLGAVQDVLPLGRIADWISSTGSRSLVART